MLSNALFLLGSFDGRRKGDRFVNFLAHLFLSGDNPELLVGNLMGDFVKGRLDGRFPSGIEQGILLHREIDSFAGQNWHFLRSKRRLDQSFGLYRGVLVDLFYDHFLAAHWEDYADVPFSVFISDAWRVLCEHKEFLPDKLQRIIPFMFRDWLPSYSHIGGIAAVLHRISRFRLKRANRLGEGAEALSMHYGGLHGDFRKFLPELIAFSASKIIGPQNLGSNLYDQAGYSAKSACASEN
jgi:acyl carrier protein phosphodiesterase